LRVSRAIALVNAGDHVRGVAEATAMAGLRGVPGGQLYNLACACSLAAAQVKADAALAERYAAQAVALLRQAAAARYFGDPATVAHMKKDTDIDPLRHRA